MNTLRNKVSLIGRIGQKPEMKIISKEYSLTRFSLAINDNYKDKNGKWVENTQWHNITAWGKTAERLVKNADKGQEIIIDGKIVNKTYEKDGEKRYSTEIEIQDFLLLSIKATDKSENTKA